MHYLKYKDVYWGVNQKTLQPPKLTSRIGGEIRAIIRNPDGSVDQDTGWVPNLITDTGLIKAGQQTWLSVCHVGSSATAPTNGDTALNSHLDYYYPTGHYVSKNPTTAPNYEFTTQAYTRFAAGKATGTIREVGFNYNTSNSNMCVHALISPEVTKSAVQVLDLHYRFTYWPGLTDDIGVVNIEGTDYNFTLRPAFINDIGGFAPCRNAFRQLGIGDFAMAYSDTIAAITSGPSSVISSPWNTGQDTELGSGSGYRDQRLEWSLDAANGNIRSLYGRNAVNATANLYGWQLRLGKVAGDGPLVKDSTKVFHVDIRTTWSRH